MPQKRRILPMRQQSPLLSPEGIRVQRKWSRLESSVTNQGCAFSQRCQVPYQSSLLLRQEHDTRLPQCFHRIGQPLGAVIHGMVIGKVHGVNTTLHKAVNPSGIDTEVELLFKLDPPAGKRRLQVTDHYIRFIKDPGYLFKRE